MFSQDCGKFVVWSFTQCWFNLQGSSATINPIKAEIWCTASTCYSVIGFPMKAGLLKQHGHHQQIRLQ